MRTDIAVIGLGAMGSASLWRLAARGARAIGFDRFDPPHALGSSHGESRLIRTAYLEGPEYVPLIQRAFALWRELERESGTSLLTQTGALMIGRPDTETITGTLASARRHGLGHELLDPAAVRRRFAQHRLGPDEVAVYEEMAGFLRPEAGVRAALLVAEARGAQVRRHTAVTRIEAGPAGVRITTPDADYQARHAVVAAGPWLDSLLPDLRLPLRVERQVLAWFPVDEPAAFAPERFPVFIHELPDGRVRYGVPTLDGRTIKLGVHHEGAITTADEIDREVGPADLSPLQTFVDTHLAGVTPEAVRSQVCMYTNTPDFHFLAGPPDGMSHITLLGGFSGHGFKFAPVMGDIAADLALRGETAYPIGLFAPTRFGARATGAGGEL